MAYADQEMSGNKIIAIIVVALIHIALGYVLITGLAYQAVKKAVERVTTVDIDEPEPPEEEPPPPPPEEIPEFVPPPFVPPPQLNVNPDRNRVQSPPKPPESAPPARTPENKVCPDGRTVGVNVQCTTPTKQCPDGLGGFKTVPQTSACPEQMKRCDYGGPVLQSQQCAEKPPEKPKFTPKDPAPRNNPGGWITPNDYRSSWISRDYAGTVSFTVSVGTNGRVQSCSVTGGSAPSDLKDASCKLIERRARFKPATDGDGNETTGTYSNRVLWQIPE